MEAVIPGVQGRILAVLADTTGELNLRTIARLSGVSAAQVLRYSPSSWAWGLCGGERHRPLLSSLSSTTTWRGV